MARAPSLTQSMSGVHTWVGLLLGWALFAIFLTGTLAVFDKEIDWWMAPELTNQDQGPVVAANVAQRWLQANHPTSSSWNIALPTERSPRLAVSVDGQRRGENTPLDAETGEPLAVRDTLGGAFFFHFHYTLHLPRLLGVWVVGFAAMAMLVALVSGIIIHKKIFKDFFTFRPAKGQRSWLDGHNASAVLLLPFHLMITYTGLAIFCVLYMPAAVTRCTAAIVRRCSARPTRPPPPRQGAASGAMRRRARPPPRPCWRSGSSSNRARRTTDAAWSRRSR